MNLYNIMITYDGEGDTNIYIPKMGDTRIMNGRPLYIENATYNVIEALRSFREMKVSIKINASKLGAYRIINYSEVNSKIRQINNTRENIRNNNISESDISNILKSANSGPITLTNNDNGKSEVNYGDYKLPSGQYEGKTLSEIDKMGKLKYVYSGFKSRNLEVKEAIDKYYESQISE